MKVVGVKVDNSGKVYYYNDNDLDLKVNLTVIINTERGLQFATVTDVTDDTNFNKYDSIVRIASKKDYLKHLKNLEDEKLAIEKCNKLIAENNLNMTIIDANYNFDKSHILFRFISDERVDFRQIAKELGAKLRTRIEFRQIGVRDKAKEIGGLGPCGRILCCQTFLTSFESVSINMVKNQGLTLNPAKINGVCGRLLCCLNYENDDYTNAKMNISDGDKKNVDKNSYDKNLLSTHQEENNKIQVNSNVIEVDKNDSKK